MSKLFFDSHKYFDFDTQLLYTDDIPKEEALTGIPFRILEYLAKNAPLPLSCDQIRQECWENDNGTGDVPYHISVLREYIEDIKIKVTRKYTYIVTRDKKYYCSIKLTSDFISDGTNSFITDELECDNNSVDYLISPLDYCKQRGIKGFLDSGLAPQVLIKNLKNKTNIYILTTTGANLITALSSDFIADSLVHGTSFTILLPNKYSEFINDVADIETPYDKELSRDAFATQFENIIKTIKREVLKAQNLSNQSTVGSVYIGCAFTYLRQTIIMGINETEVWGYQSMTMPPARTINGTTSFVFSGNINENTIAKRTYNHINALIDEAKHRFSFFEVTELINPSTFNFGLEKTNARTYWESLYRKADINMKIHMQYEDELIEVAAQHPLNHGEPDSEFKERLNFAFELYNKLRKGNRRVGIYIPGSVHTANGIQDQYSLSFAGVKYLTKLGIPIESLLGDEYNQKYKGENGVYNSADECYVASQIFLNGKYKYIHVVCSPNQMLRKQLFYISFGVIPLFHTVPNNNPAHDLIYELFEAIPDVIYNDHTWQDDDSPNAIRTRNERKPK